MDELQLTSAVWYRSSRRKKMSSKDNSYFVPDVLLPSEESHTAWVDQQTVKRIPSEAQEGQRIKRIESHFAHAFSIVLVILFRQIHLDTATWPGPVKPRAKGWKRMSFISTGLVRVYEWKARRSIASDLSSLLIDMIDQVYADPSDRKPRCNFPSPRAPFAISDTNWPSRLWKSRVYKVQAPLLYWFLWWRSAGACTLRDQRNGQGALLRSIFLPPRTTRAETRRREAKWWIETRES